MSQEEIKEHYDHFEEIIYANLLKVLEMRPKNPVSKFARMILEEAGLDKNGDVIPGKETASVRKNKKSKIDSDDESKMMKKEKKKQNKKDEESEEEVKVKTKKSKKKDDDEEKE